MRTTAFRLLTALALTAVAGGTALAQTAPPIKPGLWQMHMAREGAGAPAVPDMSEHMKSLPPEQRKRVEAMMKAHGVDVAAGPGNMKVCMSKESLDHGQWQGDLGKCKTDITDRSASSWKWHSVCTDPQAVSDGEAAFANAENYSVKNATTMTMDGQTRTSNTTISAKWLGADCGDLKPVGSPTQR